MQVRNRIWLHLFTVWLLGMLAGTIITLLQWTEHSGWVWIGLLVVVFGSALIHMGNVMELFPVDRLGGDE